MRDAWIGLVALSMVAGCASNPTVVEHVRGWPRDVEIAKEAGEPQVRVRAERRHGETLLRVSAAREVQLTRRVHYGGWRVETYGSPAGEVLDQLLAWLGYPIVGPVALGLMAAMPEASPDGVERESPPPLLILPDPTRSIFGHSTVVAEPEEDADRYVSEPVRRRYEVELPLEDEPVSYRVLDAAHRVTAEATGRTDLLGRLALPAPGPFDVAVEVTVRDVTRVVPLPPAPAPPEPEPEGAAVAPPPPGPT